MTKSGSFFSYGELRLGQGRNNTKQYLSENPELAQEIEGKIFTLLGVDRKPRPIAAVPDAPAEDAERAPRPPSPSARPRRRPRRPRSRMPPGAFELAVGAISRKERTVAELREWLAARDVERRLRPRRRSSG